MKFIVIVALLLIQIAISTRFSNKCFGNDCVGGQHSALCLGGQCNHASHESCVGHQGCNHIDGCCDNGDCCATGSC